MIGAGTLTLAGTNSYGGVTDVETGTLRLGIAALRGDGMTLSVVTVNGTLDLAGNSLTISGISGSGTVQSSGGSATLRSRVWRPDAFNGVLQDGDSGQLALLSDRWRELCPGRREHL